MTKKVRSAKGVQVDFDLLRIKEQIASSPPPMDVKKRQDFIEKRLRRRLKKVAPPAPKIDNKEEDKVEDVKMPATETLSEEPKIIDEVKTEETTEAPKTTTRRRQRKTPSTPKPADSE